MPYLKLNGTQTYFEDIGEGAPVVFGHSMLFNCRMFDQQVDFLKGNYRCIRYDFRGHGKTASPNDGYDLDTLAEDFVQLVKAVQCGPCHFVGFSMGGMVAMRVAIKYPELINSLVLIDTSSEPEPDGTMLRNEAMLFVAKYIGLRPLANKVMRMFFGYEFLRDSTRKALRNSLKEHFLAHDRKGLIKAVRGVIYRKRITEEIGGIKHPTTIMVGEKDELTRLDKAEILKSRISNASLKVIPRAGHMAPVEEPDLVNKLILEHLENL